MKIKIGLLTLLVVCGFTRLDSVFAQGTAFTYQGQLLTTNGPAHGLYDLTFALYNAASGGSQFGSIVQTNGVFVTNGLFIVAVDFGPGLFNGTAYWLQIGVRTNGAGSFTGLLQRQQLTPTPYAIYAEGGNAAGLTGTIPSGSLSGAYTGVVSLNNAGNSFSGNGAGLTGVNAALLGGLPPADFWQLTGNIVSPGQFLGSINPQPVLFEVNGAPALTLTLNGSLSMNTGSAGGNDSVALGLNATTSGGSYEVAIGNTPQATANGSVAIGWFPISSGPGSVALGESVVSSGNDSFAGGNGSHASGQYSVAMGHGSVASGISAWALGNLAQATYNGSFVWADDSGTAFTDTAPNQFLVRAAGGASFFDSVRINGNPLLLNTNSGNYASDELVWGDGGLPGGINFSGYGPFLAGFEGGALGALAPNVVAVSWDASGDAAVNESLTVDEANDNAGFLTPGLTFGNSGTEGIASQRTSGTNQFSLEFYTNLKNRMTIMQSGFVGINTNIPQAQLHVVKGIGTGASDTFDGDPAIFADVSSGDGIYVNDTDGGSYGVWVANAGAIGVVANSSSGTGVQGESSTGTGVYASSGSGSALTIGSGAIHVSGASTNSTTTAAFTQVATASNIASDYTLINNTLCNGDPNAILIVTPNWNPQGNGGTYWNHVVGVFYDTSASKWAIFNEDLTAMPAGPAFNVLIIKN